MECIQIYTDGAASNNQSTDKSKVVGGWGVVLIYNDHVKEFYDGVINTTNNRMELQACIEALKQITRFDIPIEVYTDSQYVEHGVNIWIYNWEKNGWKNANKKNKDIENQDLWKELIALKRQFTDIKFVKVKGHSDDKNNIRADQLAQKGINLIKIK